MNTLENSLKTTNPAQLQNSTTKVVEIVGPPGSGKTTLCKALVSKWSVNSKWIHPTLLLSGKSATTGISWPRLQLLKILNRTHKSVPVDFGLRYVKENKNLAEFLWKHINDPDTFRSDQTAMKFRSSYFMFRDFSSYQAIWEANHPVPCLLEEGMLTKSFMISDNIDSMYDLVDQYMSLLPLPHAVIYLSTENTDELVDRVFNRKKTIASHQNKTSSEIKTDIANWKSYFDIVSGKLQQLGVPVFQLDGQEPVTVNAKIVNDLFNRGVL